MNIVCSTDDNFVQHCCIMLTSVLMHNDNIRVYLFTAGLKEENLKIIKEEVEYKGGEFHHKIVDVKIISQLPMPDISELSHISSVTYYRLLMTYLLPEDIDKVLYLDCDIIVRKPLKGLWEIDIDNYALGGVYQIAKETVEEITRLGYPPEFGYFNAGVLLINLGYWRIHKISDKLLSYLFDNYDLIKYHDQDALNFVLHKECLKLPVKWNMMSVYFFRDIFLINDVYNGEVINSYSDYKDQLEKEILNPTLIHYVSKPKPWDPYSVHPFRKKYYDYAKFSIKFKSVRYPDNICSYIYYNLYNTFVIKLYKNNFKVWFYRICLSKSSR